MKRYREEILELLEQVKESGENNQVGFGIVKRRNDEEFPPFLKSGVASAAIVLSKQGTHMLYRHRKAVDVIKSTDAIGTNEAIDKLVTVQEILKETRGTRTFRRKDGWFVPRREWGEIFTGDGLTAVDRLIKTETIVIGKGDEEKEGTMFYFPQNSFPIAGAARLICDELYRSTGDPVFNIRVIDRQAI